MSTPYLNLTNAAGKVAAFSTAVRLGLLDRIDREPANPAELARTCGATERGVRVVLAALAEGGFVEQLADGRYRPVLTGLAALHPLIPLWDHLPDAVRTGIPVYDPNSASPGNAIYPRTMTYLASLWGDAVDHAISTLPAATRILDVGAGAEPWTISYCRGHPKSHITALDLPEVLPSTRRAVSRAGLTDRYTFLPGDVLTTPLEPCTYDLIIVAQVCSLFDRSNGSALIKRLTPALAEEGVLAIIDTLAGAPGSAMQELSLYLRTQAGAVHQPDAYYEWLADAGLTDITSTDLPTTLAIAVLTGRKPRQSASAHDNR
ncbi:methyltransferase [Kibdelosporangium aridum]|uniref:Ubiquinone/menaquinone biosynthesis C-methylase UbiE n=1 Tax=Kibdelosporangium aridum TaxID=2030 RepID=A0A1W2FRL1_KIBAR|nr:methyltransferase [Kibdelosporangium aridum]SMD24256.1 Ubiquinone/menaquinone biosynthesis C-methylase UbiE [Kibdelosporangium aridum]